MENIIDLRPMIDPHVKPSAAVNPATAANIAITAKPATTETALKEQKPYWQVIEQKYGFQPHNGCC